LRSAALRYGGTGYRQNRCLQKLAAGMKSAHVPPLLPDYRTVRRWDERRRG